MKKPTDNTGLYVCLILASVCTSLLFWFHKPLALFLLPAFSLVFLTGGLVYNQVHNLEFRRFLQTLVHRNSIDVQKAIELLEVYEEESPYWELINKKVYEDLDKMDFIRDFCPVIAKNQKISSAYTGRFIQQGHGNAVRALRERQKMIISKPNDDGTIKYFLDALEACLSCVNTTVVGRTMAPEEYEAVEVVMTMLDKQTLTKVMNEWPKLRTQKERVPWEHHWDGLWSYLREKYTEAIQKRSA